MTERPTLGEGGPPTKSAQVTTDRRYKTARGVVLDGSGWPREASPTSHAGPMWVSSVSTRTPGLVVTIKAGQVTSAVIAATD
jgi:hypothetical protein